MACVFCVTTLLAFVSTAGAQTIDCSLRPVASNSFEKDRWVSADVKKSKPMVLTFSDFDFENKRARMIGNQSGVDVILFSNKRQIDLLEITDSGNKMLTTLVPITDDLWTGVHSRHTVIIDLVPSQYVGECRKR